MLLLPGLLLVAIFVVFTTALFKPARRVDALLAYYLLGFGEIVLIAEAASLLRLLNSAAFVLGAHALLAALAGLAWWRAGRPALFPHLPGSRWNWADLKRSLLRWPDLYALGALVAGAYAVGAGLNLLVPPNTNDSMSTHMSRVGYWLQHGSFAPWATPYTWQTIYPLNAQANFLWTILLSGSDHFVGFVQWTAAFACMLAIFGMARLLGASRPQATFAALIFATFPEVILQSTTTQNDLVVAALFTVTVYFLYRAILDRRRALFVLSGIGLGLAVGAKQTTFFILPGLALALLLLLAFRKVDFKSLVLWAAVGLVSIALVGSYMYVSNLARFGNPLGPSEVVDQNSGARDGSLLEQTVLSSARLLYQSADLTGLPRRVVNVLMPYKARAAAAFFNAIGLPIEAGYTARGHTFDLERVTAMQEDEAWYGPLGFALLGLMMVVAAVQGLRKKEPFRLGLIVTAFVYLICTAAFRPGWDPYQGRYFLLGVALCAGLMAFFVVPNRAGLLGRVLVILVALVVVRGAVLYNEGKPILISPKNALVLRGDRIDRITLQGGFMIDVLRLVEANVPADATLGLYTYQGYWDYPLFGEHFTRAVIPIYPHEQIGDDAWLREQDIQYLLVNFSRGYPENLPASAQLLGHLDEWDLYRVQ